MAHPEPTDRERFAAALERALSDGAFRGLTLARPSSEPGESQAERIECRMVELKDGAALSARLRYPRRDETKNLPLDRAAAAVAGWLDQGFRDADLRCAEERHWLRVDRKGRAHLVSSRVAGAAEPASTGHDRAKRRSVDPASPWLHIVGLSDERGRVIPRQADKYRQVDRFVEIVGADLAECDFPAGRALSLVDMGSGKAYLTFALYERLRRDGPVWACGVERRGDLVEKCAEYARQAGFAPGAGEGGLLFRQGGIADWNPAADEPWSRPDVLVALHACDTATDDAILEGVRRGASLIVCSPCCHKQVRTAMRAAGEAKLLTRFGILEERLAEMVTDGVRALVLEAFGYKVKVFEFVSAEHSGKNLMITARRVDPGAAGRARRLAEARSLLAAYGVSSHYLLERLDPSERGD